MGLAIGVLGVALGPARRRELGAAHLGRPVPRRRRSCRACTSRTCFSSRSLIAALLALHLLRRRPDHTAVPGPRRDRAERRRDAMLSRLGAALAGALVRRRRRSCSCSAACPDQPDLAVGPVPRRRRDQRRAARLVPRLADRRAAADARLRRRDRRPHGRAEPVLGRRALPGARLRRSCSLWPWLERRFSGRPAAGQTCSTARATARAHRGRRRARHVALRDLPRRLGRPRVRCPSASRTTAQIWFWRIAAVVIPILGFLIARAICRRCSGTEAHPLRGWTGTAFTALRRAASSRPGRAQCCPRRPSVPSRVGAPPRSPPEASGATSRR